MPRGGRRFGTPGTAYGNRTDLSAPEAVQTVPGQPYGVAGKQAAAQKAIPIQGTQVPGAAPAVAGAGVPAGEPVAPPTPPPVLPGTLGFADPSARPDEPVQHGLAVGPGAGPEVLPPMAQQVHATVRDMVTELANRVPSPALATLASYAQHSL